MSAHQYGKMKVSSISVQYHGFDVGDTVHIHGESFWKFLVRPRILEVIESSESELIIVERRMSWAEWRQEIGRLAMEKLQTIFSVSI